MARPYGPRPRTEALLPGNAADPARDERFMCAHGSQRVSESHSICVSAPTAAAIHNGEAFSAGFWRDADSWRRMTRACRPPPCLTPRPESSSATTVAPARRWRADRGVIGLRA